MQSVQMGAVQEERELTWNVRRMGNTIGVLSEDQTVFEVVLAIVTDKMDSSLWQQPWCPNHSVVMAHGAAARKPTTQRVAGIMYSAEGMYLV